MYLERFSDGPVTAARAHTGQQAMPQPCAPEVVASQRQPVAALVDGSLEGQTAAWRAGFIARQGRVPLQLLWTGRTKTTSAAGQQIYSLQSLCWHLQEELHIPVVSRDLRGLLRGVPADATAPSLRVVAASSVGSMLSGVRLRTLTEAACPILLVRRALTHKYKRVVGCLDAIDDPVTMRDLAVRVGADPAAASNARVVAGCNADAVLAAEEAIFADLLLVSRHLGRAAAPWSGRNTLATVLAGTQADVLLL